IVFNTPQNIQTGTTIVISWTFSGIQPTRAELGIMNSQTSAITVIDSNVDLTKQSENWIVFVGPGSYRLYIMDGTSYSYTYSNLFTVSNSGSKNNPTQVNYPPPSTQSDPSVTSQGNSISEIKSKLFIAAPIIFVIVIGVIICFYMKRRNSTNGGGVNVYGNNNYVTQTHY
ncbi:hypothetical protein F8M41_010884, partial [Gigaspora margarita]